MFKQDNVQIIVVTHGNFSYGLKDSLEMIVGEKHGVDFASLKPGQNIDEFTQSLLELITKENILILVDLFGGTPFNVASKISLEESDLNIEVVTGVNLPMLVHLVSTELSSLKDYVDNAIEIGKSSIRQFEIIETDKEDEL